MPLFILIYLLGVILDNIKSVFKNGIELNKFMPIVLLISLTSCEAVEVSYGISPLLTYLIGFIILLFIVYIINRVIKVIKYHIDLERSEENEYIN